MLALLGLLLTKQLYMLVACRFLVTIGHNVLFCAHHYNVSVDICNRLSSLDNLVKSCVHNSIDDNKRCFANLLYELMRKKTILK